MPNFTHVFDKTGPVNRQYIPMFMSIAMGFALLLCTASLVSAATINVPADYATISAAVAAASPGDIILVAPGTYNENVVVNKANLTIRSTGGAGVTTIQGSNIAPGSVHIPNGINGVTIGGVGQGFKIIGYNGPGGIEYAAVYLTGAHSNIYVVGNIIEANGEHGLLSEYNAAINGIYITDNTFSGKTFVGAEPGGCGFSTQFNAGNNVPRQLVVMGGGAGVTNSMNVYFINNQVTGTAGGFNSTDNCEQGNYLVTIDVIGATITQNTFSGTTTGTAGSLRTRGQATNIYCNTFNTAGLGANCVNIFFGSANPLTAASPNTLAGVASSNAFPQGGAYLTPNHASSYIIYRSVAQATTAATTIGAGQTAVAASATLNCPVTNTNTGRIFGTIQAAINDASTLNGHTLAAAAGTYNEDVTVNKDLTIQGAGMNACTVSGPIGGGGATFQVASPGVIIEGFTITRDGNNVTDWNGALNTAGVAIQGQANDAEIRNCKLTGNRTAIDVNNSNDNNIHNNVITFNHTGLIFRNQTDNTALTENEITDNRTVGVLFLDASGGTNSPVQSALNSTFNDNNISGNWYGQIVDRQSGGSLPAPGTTNMKNFECNWYGTTTPVVSTANSAEPSYTVHIPVAYGGTATAPGGQPDILGPASANFDYLLFLANGTDDAPATDGFQPAPLSCTGGCPGGGVVINTNSNGIFCSIQDAINAATSGDRLKVATGTYTENVDATAKDIEFAPGNSPGCVNIVGNMTLNSGDELEIEINGTTPCTDHDQFIVSGTVTLGGATLTLPAGMYLASMGDEIKIIDGSNPIVGTFAQGNFVTDGTNTYYINYAGGDGNDVVLTKCCGSLLDIGIFNHIAASPTGNKLQVKVRPNMDAINGSYSSGTFTIRTLSSNGVTFTNLGSPFGYAQIGPKLTSGGYDYFFFNFESVYPVNWTANTEYPLLTLGYDCIANATFELINDAFAISNGGGFYQELGAQEAQGVFYQATATSPAAVSITATSNSPVCETMNIDLNSTTMNGSMPYSYVWSGPDSYSNNVADPAPFAATLAAAGTYYVTVTDGNGCAANTSTVVVVPASGACVLNVNTTLLYPTITEAIDAAATMNGHTLQVPAGTWAENLIVNKSLTIKGPNALIDPCTGMRVAEAIVVPAVSAISSGEIIHVAASNVTITGFTIDGDNTSIATGYTSTTAADIDAAEGITVYETGINNLTVTNNILKNLSYFGVTLYDYPAGVPSSGHLISNNKFQDFGTYDAGSGIAYWGGGVLLYNNQYAAVTNNCMTNLRVGVQTGNFSQANPGMAVYQVIDNNTMSVRRRGIFHNLFYGTASAYTLSNNNITGIMNANETVWDGILLSSLSVPSTSTANIINGAGITNPSEGYEVWNVKNTSPAAISGGSVSNVATGLFVNNYEGYNSDAGDGAHASVTGLSVSPNAAGTGIRVLDSPSSTLHAAVSLAINAGVTVTGGTHGLSVENSSASITGGTLNNLVLNTQTGNYIQLAANAGNLDGTAVSFDGNTGATATLAQNFAIEDKIVHKIDNGALGYVSVKANHDFVTVNSFIMPATSIASIQRGVNAASNGYTVNVAAGTYTDNVTIDKEVTILGAGQLLTFVQPLATNPNPGGCGGASLCAGASNVMLVQANNVSIKELTIDGNNPAITSGISAGGSDLDARNGIITNHILGTYNNLLVNNVTVKNIYLRGIYASSGGTFTFSNNTVDNVQADPGSIAMFNFLGAGFFTNNMVSNANDGIASNWSKGTVYSGNTVTSSGSGIHTDNNGGSGGVADTIRNNTVTNSTTGGYGIWVFAPYVNVHVKENTVTNVDVGLANAGQFAAVTTRFERNTVDGMNKANSAGVYQTTDLFGFGTADVSGLYINNFIKNNTDGFYVEYQVGKTNTITVNDNSITGNTTGVTLVSGGTLVNNFNCNWWGSDNIDVVDVLVDANVNFVPFLNNSLDNSADPGFQPVPASCVYPTHWYVNDNALAGDVYTLAVGNDLNPGTKRWPFLTIGKAIMSVVSGDTIFVDAGTYNEQSVVPNTKDNLLFKGAGLSTIVDFTGTVSGKPTLFDIAGDGVVIDSFQFNTDLSKLSSAIIASDAGLDNITIKNNKINPYQSVSGTYFGSYGNRNAISINYNGGINYRVASGGVNNIVVDNNIVTATVNPPLLGGPDPLDIGFRAAVAVDEGAGTYTRNIFQAISHDVLVRFNSNGAVIVGGSVANANNFNGGGVQYADPNAGGGTVTISHNTFDGSVTGSVLRLQNNYYNATTTVSNNIFTNLRWGISLENFPAATVSNNAFTPLAGYTTFRHITVNTKSLSSNSSSILQVPINGVFTGNTFNSLTPTVGGTAMAFYNHDSDNDNLGTFTVGTSGSPNVFAKDFTYAVYLGDQTGPTIPAPGAFPEYDLGAGSNTTMACWDKDIDIQNNTFDVGSGAQLPPAMNHAQRLALEAILWHLPDNPCLGELIYFLPVEVYAKVFLQGPYDSSSGLMNDNLRAASLIPTSEPYTSINTTFPGSFVKVNNFVTETVNPTVFATTGNDAIVDWIWLELRDKTDSTTVLATRSALVQRDGDIVDLDGTSAVLFPDSYVDEYFLMVRHRNHLGARTAARIDYTGAPFVDFTSPIQATYGTTATSARRLIKTNVYGLWAGNTIPKSAGGFQIKYNGSENDRNAILVVVGPGTPLNIVSNVYMLEDVNMNTEVKYSGSGNDRVIILNNVGPSTPLNIITQQPNN